MLWQVSALLSQLLLMFFSFSVVVVWVLLAVVAALLVQACFVVIANSVFLWSSTMMCGVGVNGYIHIDCGAFGIVWIYSAVMLVC